MIQKITVVDSKIKELENAFPHYFGKTSVKKLLLDNQFTSIFTFTDDNRIVAFIIYDLLYERCELIQIEVLEEYRNKKIASKYYLNFEQLFFIYYRIQRLVLH